MAETTASLLLGAPHPYSQFLWVLWLIQLRFYVPLDTKIGHFGDVPEKNLGLV